MEFYFSWFFWWISIDVFNFDDFRHVFNDGNDSFELVSLNHIDYLLLEELIESGIALSSQFGIFVKVFFHLNGKHVDQMFGPRVLDRHLDDSFLGLNNITDSTDDGDLHVFGSKKLVQSSFILKLNSSASELI